MGLRMTREDDGVAYYITMSDLRQYNQKFLTQMIELYKFHPTLWQVKNKDYRNKDKKAAAYEVLVNKFREVEPDCTRDTVVKKINSLRTCYRKEFNKVQRSIKNGEVYKPKLWYYDLLSFLNDENFVSDSILYLDEDMGSDCDPFYSQNESSTDSPSTSVFASSERGKRKLDNDYGGDSLQMQNNINTEDEFDLLGRVYANKLRKLAMEQRIYAEKIINDAFFEAELGNLNRRCRLDISNTERRTTRPQINSEVDLKPEYIDSADTSFIDS